MNRRQLMKGAAAILGVAALPIEAWARPLPRYLDKPNPRLDLAGVAPRYPDRMIIWAKDCIHWRGRVLVGARAHWCWDWDGLPVDETTAEHETCTCEWDLPLTAADYGSDYPRRSLPATRSEDWITAATAADGTF